MCLADTLPWEAAPDIQVEACDAAGGMQGQRDAVHLAGALLQAVRDKGPVPVVGGGQSSAGDALQVHLDTLLAQSWFTPRTQARTGRDHEPLLKALSDGVGCLDPPTVHMPQWACGAAAAAPGPASFKNMCNNVQCLAPSECATAVSMLRLLALAISARAGGVQRGLGGGQVTVKGGASAIAAVEACGLALHLTQLTDSLKQAQNQPNATTQVAGRLQGSTAGASMATCSLEDAMQAMQVPATQHGHAAQLVALQLHFAHFAVALPPAAMLRACPWLGLLGSTPAGRGGVAAAMVCDACLVQCTAAQTWLDGHCDRSCIARWPLWRALQQLHVVLGEASKAKAAKEACTQLWSIFQHKRLIQSYA